MINFNEANFEKSIGNLGQLVKENIPEIVFSGKSNVGKSSLINKILNRKSLARTSSKPGKTININFYKLKNIRFVDLPGYGYAQVSFKEKKRWSELVEGYFEKDRNIKLIIQIIDVRHPASALDMQMIEFLSSQNFPFIIVASKCDKLNKTNRQMREKMMEKELSSYEDIPRIIFSSQTGEGIEKIKSIISDYCDN
ncbi:MAG: ribosome biogenesis GTP-binding protein YihA/YsxC [Clostridia bacterium]|mgnify:FL=1|nr:ribosome biogenesis GTP-binding protein YihA/YsxC [Clostridia bacterium]